MQKSEYPPQKCNWCGGKSLFESLTVNCNRKYEYVFRCTQCKKRMYIMEGKICKIEDQKNINVTNATRGS